MHNCGTCGHDCQGGTCMGSACQPVFLAAGTEAALGIAIDATNVYWTEIIGHVYSAPLTGGAATKLGNTGAGAYGIALVGNTLYVTSDGANVWRLSTTPGTPIQVASVPAGEGVTIAIAADASNVYFSTWSHASPPCVV